MEGATIADSLTAQLPWVYVRTSLQWHDGVTPNNDDEPPVRMVVPRRTVQVHDEADGPSQTGVTHVGRPEDDAARLLREIGWDRIPVDPVRIARMLNLRIYAVEMDEGVSGALRIRPGQDPEIFLNERDSANRQRFTCAHEIGHFRKRVEEGLTQYEVVDRRDIIASQGSNADEVYANQFAAALLMPAGLVKEMWRKEKDLTILAYRFNVSVDAMNYRLKNLGLR